MKICIQIVRRYLLRPKLKFDYFFSICTSYTNLANEITTADTKKQTFANVDSLRHIFADVL